LFSTAHVEEPSDRIDDALFNASFDVGNAVTTWPLDPSVLSDLGSAIERLFAQYYAASPRSVSCAQFWDNILGYKDWEHAPASGHLFAADAATILSRLLFRHEVHIRRSAVHGLNHHPDMNLAAKLLTSHSVHELDPEVRTYCEDVLTAFRDGKRLV
jgi:hypothetical protein